MISGSGTAPESEVKMFASIEGFKISVSIVWRIYSKIKFIKYLLRVFNQKNPSGI